MREKVWDLQVQRLDRLRGPSVQSVIRLGSPDSAQAAAVPWWAQAGAGAAASTYLGLVPPRSRRLLAADKRAGGRRAPLGRKPPEPRRQRKGKRPREAAGRLRAHRAETGKCLYMVAGEGAACFAQAAPIQGLRKLTEVEPLPVFPVDQHKI